jgi:hypothetical protein
VHDVTRRVGLRTKQQLEPWRWLYTGQKVPAQSDRGTHHHHAGPSKQEKGVCYHGLRACWRHNTHKEKETCSVEGHHVHSTLRKRVVDRDANFVKSPSSENPEGHTQLPTNNVGRYHSGPLTAAGAAGTSREAQPPPTTALPLMQPPCVPSHTRHSMADGSTGAGNTRSRDGSA